MDYIGSKEKLNLWIFDLLEKVAKPNSIFLDACCGSGSVSRYAARQGYTVVANDNMAFPSHLVRGSIGVQECLSGHYDIAAHVKIINSLPGVDGFFYHQYSPVGGRKYFTVENARFIDACRAYIHGIENQILKSALIYCSLEAMSRCSNTAGTHGAYLKKFKGRARKQMQVKLEPMIAGTARAYTGDILDFLQSEIETYDIFYLDPPYTNRKYAPNYHLYETFASPADPDVKGKTGLRANWQSEAHSDFCSSKTVEAFFEKVLAAVKCNLLLISYSSDGLLPLSRITKICRGLGYCFYVDERRQKRYKADNKRTNKSTPLSEYLIVCEKP